MLGAVVPAEVQTDLVPDDSSLGWIWMSRPATIAMDANVVEDAITANSETTTPVANTVPMV